MRCIVQLPPERSSACPRLTDAPLLNTPSDESNPESQPASENPAPLLVTPSPSTNPIVRWLKTRGRDLAYGTWRFAFDVAHYYWGMRQPLWEYVAGFLPDLASDSVRMRTVRLSPDESHRTAEFGPEGWKVLVPGRCVVCGQKSQNPTTDETKLVDNAARAFWFPTAALLFGVSIGWFLFGRWMAIVSLPLGIAAGYLMRSKIPVLLRLVRCDAHQSRLNIPKVLAWGNTLVLRFGDKTVRKIFLYGETMDFSVPQVDAAGTDPATAAAHAESESVPETIPLADSPDPATSQIKHDLPPTFGPDDEKPSPPVP